MPFLRHHASMIKLPLIGLGTWELRGRECTQIVRQALDLGYRHIDTAHAYDNHKVVHKAIAGFDRSKLFITSKFSLEQIDPAKIQKSVEKNCELALEELGTDYIDLYLIHWPNLDLPLGQIFKAMEKLASEGKILRAGVCNFTIHHLEDLRSEACNPAANQVEFHPYLYQKELLDYCRKHKIQLIAFRPLGKGKLLTDPLFKTIGERHKKSPAQVVLRWIVQKEIPVIPKASSEKHLRENLEIFNFSLSDDEMRQLDALNKNMRFCKPEDPAFKY